jgi:5'(3')-deoxyribonucleotidase
MNPIIYCDLDGVLADFIGEVCRETHEKYKDVSQWDYFTKVKSKDLSFVDSYDFWYNLEWTKHGKEILNICKNKTPHLYLLTCPWNWSLAAEGRIDWIQCNIPELKSHLILTQTSKGLFAKKGRILIDDNDLNCLNFAAGGGKTLQIPQPWGSRRAEWKSYTIQKFEKELDQLCGKIA